MKLYGYNVINNEGWGNGKESLTRIYVSQRLCIDMAYKEYSRLHNELKNKLDEDYKQKQKKSEFKDDFLNSNYPAGVMQFADSHIQFEYYDYELELPESYSK